MQADYTYTVMDPILGEIDCGSAIEAEKYAHNIGATSYTVEAWDGGEVVQRTEVVVS